MALRHASCRPIARILPPNLPSPASYHPSPKATSYRPLTHHPHATTRSPASYRPITRILSPELSSPTFCHPASSLASYHPFHNTRILSPDHPHPVARLLASYRSTTRILPPTAYFSKNAFLPNLTWNNEKNRLGDKILCGRMRLIGCGWSGDMMRVMWNGW